MNCVFEWNGEGWKCIQCGRLIRLPNDRDRRNMIARCRDRTAKPHDESKGVGTELKALLKQLGIKPKANCACQQRAKKMNRLGIRWCKDNRELILNWLREGYDEATTLEKLKAGVLSLWSWGPMTLDGILDEAILRAEKHAG